MNIYSLADYRKRKQQTGEPTTEATIQKMTPDNSTWLTTEQMQAKRTETEQEKRAQRNKHVKQMYQLRDK